MKIAVIDGRSSRQPCRLRTLTGIVGLSLGLPLAAALPCATEAADLEQLTAVEAVREICSGALTSETLTLHAIAQAKAIAPLNAFVAIGDAGARRAAREVDARRKAGARCRPLEGLPVAIKDNIHVAGLPSTAGTPALKDFWPAADAPVVARLRAAGAVVIGKTSMHELAFGISGYNPFHSHGDVGARNAYDSTRMAGGSSSGNGAALGRRVVLAALGTDTGGSVRIPCALNGCAGLRPTIGRYPAAGIAPISHTRDTAGPMAQTVADLALLDRVLAGTGDAVRPAALSGVRLGLVRHFTGDLDADTQAAFDGALAKLREAGVQLVEAEMPRLAELNRAVSFPVALFEANGDMVAYLRRYRVGITLQQLAWQIASPDVKAMYERFVIPRKLPGPGNTVVDVRSAYESAMRRDRPALQRLYAQTFATHTLDALVFPTVPTIATLAEPEASSPQTFGVVARNTDPGANAGIPGLSLPVTLGLTSGLPIGLEIDGPKGSDRRLLAIGMALETLFGRLPPPRSKKAYGSPSGHSPTG